MDCQDMLGQKEREGTEEWKEIKEYLVMLDQLENRALLDHLVQLEHLEFQDLSEILVFQV